MGAGKSTIGKRLARELECAFTDLDAVIEEKAGKPITDIFEDDGEPAFRELERSCLLDAIRTFEGVLALGGGTLQNQHMVDHVKINGLLIFIETPFSVIFDRVSDNRERPLLLNEDGTLKDEDAFETELRELYEGRLTYYRQAEITIHTDTGSSVEETTAALVRKIRNHVSHH